MHKGCVMRMETHLDSVSSVYEKFIQEGHI